MSLFNMYQNHELGDVDCPSCDDQFGFCSCGGTIHCEYQATLVADFESRFYAPKDALVLCCDHCDDYEIE